jgi:hypothetical protein
MKYLGGALGFIPGDNVSDVRRPLGSAAEPTDGLVFKATVKENDFASAALVVSLATTTTALSSRELLDQPTNLYSFDRAFILAILVSL